MKTKITIISIFIGLNLYSQLNLDSTSLHRKIKFMRLEQARKVNPDSVKYLDIGSSGFKKFPTEILKYKNLIELKITDYDSLKACENGIIDSAACAKFNKRCNELRKKYGEVWFGEYEFPIYNPNIFTKIPKQIKELKALKILWIYQTSLNSVIPKSMAKKLIKWLPNCYVIQPYESLDKQTVKKVLK